MKKKAEKVIDFPAEVNPEIRDINLWVILVGGWPNERCRFLYNAELKCWDVSVKARSFAKASELVGECQRLLGMTDGAVWRICENG